MAPPAPAAVALVDTVRRTDDSADPLASILLRLDDLVMRLPTALRLHGVGSHSVREAVRDVCWTSQALRLASVLQRPMSELAVDAERLVARTCAAIALAGGRRDRRLAAALSLVARTAGRLQLALSHRSQPESRH